MSEVWSTQVMKIWYLLTFRRSAKSNNTVLAILAREQLRVGNSSLLITLFSLAIRFCIKLP